MKISEIKNLKNKDINKMSIEDLKDAIKTAQREQTRRFKRMENNKVENQSPLYRGIEKELNEKGIRGTVSKNFKKLHNARSNDQAVLKNELRDMIGIINRPTATTGGTKKYIKREYERLFGKKSDSKYWKWWSDRGAVSFWDAYEKAKEYGLVSAYGSGEAQAMIREYELNFDRSPSPEDLEKIFFEFGSSSAFKKEYDVRKDMEDELFTALS